MPGRDPALVWQLLMSAGLPLTDSESHVPGMGYMEPRIVLERCLGQPEREAQNRLVLLLEAGAGFCWYLDPSFVSISTVLGLFLLSLWLPGPPQPFPWAQRLLRAPQPAPACAGHCAPAFTAFISRSSRSLALPPGLSQEILPCWEHTLPWTTRLRQSCLRTSLSAPARRGCPGCR